jgi:hypothetical protein
MTSPRIYPRRGRAHPLLLERLLGTPPLRERVNGLDLVPDRVRLMVSVSSADDVWLEARAVEEGVSRAELLRRGLALLRGHYGAQNSLGCGRQTEPDLAA